MRQRRRSSRSLRPARRQEVAAGEAAFADVTRADRRNDVPVDLRPRSRLRHFFTRAIARYPEIEQHAFRKAGVSVVRLTHAHGVCGWRKKTASCVMPGRKALIVAGLNTGARVGELLSMQWWQVERDDDGRPVRLRLVADKTKTSRTRITTRRSRRRPSPSRLVSSWWRGQSMPSSAPTAKTGFGLHSDSRPKRPIPLLTGRSEKYLILKG